MIKKSDRLNELGDKVDEVDKIIASLDAKTPDERRAFYRECAKRALILYLTENQLEKEPIELAECEAIEELETEAAIGMGQIFKIRNSFWGVTLFRDSDCQNAILRNPQLIKDPALLIMNLRKATFTCLTDRFPEFN